MAGTGFKDNSTLASLYVGDLSPHVNEPLLFEMFNAVGPVQSIRVCRDSLTRVSLGYAYVNFHTHVDAKNALEHLNYTIIGDRPCRIMWSQKNVDIRTTGVGNIYVKNLDSSIDHKSLHDTFSVFGKVFSCKVGMDKNGNSLGYGFVQYENENDAKSAIDNANGMSILGRVVSVEAYKPKTERPQLSDAFTNLYVKHLPFEMKENEFIEVFKPFGEIQSAKLMEDNQGRFKGFGFINMVNHEDALAAIEALNNKKLQDTPDDALPLYVSRAMSKTERIPLVKKAKDQARIQQEQEWAGCNLYVKNLNDSVDSEGLVGIFSIFGPIKSTKVSVNPETQKSKCFGFVCFESPDDASRALQEMHGKLVDGKPLYVTYFESRETRRYKMEMQLAAQQGQYGMIIPGPIQGGRPNTGFQINGIPNREAYKQQPREVNKSSPQVGGGLTLAALAAASPEEQRQLIGERLYPLVAQIEPIRAGKVTGMLLEMDKGDILELLESKDRLNEKVSEAILVLNEHLAK